MKETQALLNDRPLVALSEEALDVITPSMLTHGKKLRPFKESFGEFKIPGKTQAKIRWQHQTEVMDHLYTLWQWFSRDFCSDPIIGLRVSPATHITPI